MSGRHNRCLCEGNKRPCGKGPTEAWARGQRSFNMFGMRCFMIENLTDRTKEGGALEDAAVVSGSRVEGAANVLTACARW